MTDNAIREQLWNKLCEYGFISKEAYECADELLEIIRKAATHPATSLAAPDSVVKALSGLVPFEIVQGDSINIAFDNFPMGDEPSGIGKPSVRQGAIPDSSPAKFDEITQDIDMILATSGDLDEGFIYATKRRRGNIGGVVTRACERIKQALASLPIVQPDDMIADIKMLREALKFYGREFPHEDKAGYTLSQTIKYEEA